MRRRLDASHCSFLATEAHWGSGTTSSSDAQFFHAGARGEVGGLVNLHYGLDPGVKSYTHLSDQIGPFHTKPQPLTRRPMSSTDCFITRAALSSTNTTPTPAASPIMSLPCAVCWASALRRAFAT